MHNPNEFHLNLSLLVLKSIPRKSFMFSKHNHADIIIYYDLDCDV